MTQQELPPASHPSLTPETAAKAIQAHLDADADRSSWGMDVRAMELCGLPTWDWVHNEWRAVVKVTPWGPLVVAGFKLKGKAT